MKMLKVSVPRLSAAGFILATVCARGATLEEVVVTADKRERTIQEVSRAVTAVSDDQLNDGLINNVEDLQAILPGVSAGNDFGQAKIFFRGLGLSSSYTAVDPSIAMYVDNAIITRAEAQLGSFFDLERIEALRGPQGTLYGRNAVGGSLNLITKKPTEVFEGYGIVTVGTYDLLQLEGAAGGPLSERVLGRIAFKSVERSGFAVNEVNGSDVSNAHKQAVRGHLQFNVNDDVDFLLSGEFSNEDDKGLVLAYVGETFADPAVFVPGRGGFPEKRRDIASDTEPQNDKDTWAITGTLNWKVGDAWTIRSLTNYRALDVGLAWENDASSIVTDDAIYLNFKSKAFSQELQALFDGERLSGIVGLYFINEDLHHFQIGGCGKLMLDQPTPGCQANGSVARVMEVRATQNIEAAAAFASSSYKLTNQVTVNAGVRYSYEKRKAANAVFFNFPDFNLVSFTVGNSFDDPLLLSDSFNDVSPSVGLEWRPGETQNTMLYLNYSEAFKSGAVLSGFGTNVVKPEEVENLEAGVKTDLFGERVRLNVAAFVYDAKNLQFDATVPLPNGTFAQRFENAASLQGKGIEVESTWIATRNFRLSGFGGWLDAEFDKFVSSDPTEQLGVVRLQDLSGNRPRQAPEWTGYLRGEYDFHLTSGGMITVGAQGSYKSEQFFTEFNRSNQRQAAYTLLDMNIKYTSPTGKFLVNVWGNNLTDEYVRSGMFASGGGRVLTEALLPPASGGITFQYNFD